jgi:hypothetical protein
LIQARKVVVNSQELQTGDGVEGQMHKRIPTVRKIVKLAPQRTGRSRQATRGNPDGVSLIGCHLVDDGRHIILSKASQSDLVSDAERSCRRGHHRGRAGHQPSGQKTQQVDGVLATRVDVIDDDQTLVIGEELADSDAGLKRILSVHHGAGLG